MKTAVEWLINELKTSIHYQRVINEVNQSSTDVKDVIKQAKQIADDFAIGFLKFANKNYIYRKGHYHMKGDFEKSININQQQLLEIYKKEKGL